MLELEAHTHHGSHATRIDVVVNTTAYLRVKPLVSREYAGVRYGDVSTALYCLVETVAECDVINTQERSFLYKEV